MVSLVKICQDYWYIYKYFDSKVDELKDVSCAQFYSNSNGSVRKRMCSLIGFISTKYISNWQQLLTFNI